MDLVEFKSHEARKLLPFAGLPAFGRSLKLSRMRDRLSELVRQRALVSEHLAWLDREIERTSAETAPPAAAGGITAAPTPTSATPLPLNPSPPSPGAKPPTTAAVVIPTQPGPTEIPGDAASAPSEDILEQYRVSPTTVHQDVRKGCLLYFAAAFVVLGIVVAILYFTISNR